MRNFYHAAIIFVLLIWSFYALVPDLVVFAYFFLGTLLLLLGGILLCFLLRKGASRKYQKAGLVAGLFVLGSYYIMFCDGRGLAEAGRAFCNTMIPIIDSNTTNEGRYPHTIPYSLKEILIAPGNVRYSRCNYQTFNEGRSFTLSVHWGFLNMFVYDSSKKEWEYVG